MPMDVEIGYYIGLIELVFLSRKSLIDGNRIEKFNKVPKQPSHG